MIDDDDDDEIALIKEQNKVVQVKEEEDSEQLKKQSLDELQVQAFMALTSKSETMFNEFVKTISTTFGSLTAENSTLKDCIHKINDKPRKPGSLFLPNAGYSTKGAQLYDPSLGPSCGRTYLKTGGEIDIVKPMCVVKPRQQAKWKPIVTAAPTAAPTAPSTSTEIVVRRPSTSSDVIVVPSTSNPRRRRAPASRSAPNARRRRTNVSPANSSSSSRTNVSTANSSSSSISSVSSTRSYTNEAPRYPSPTFESFLSQVVSSLDTLSAPRRVTVNARVGTHRDELFRRHS